MSQRFHRTLIVCVALVGCDTPAVKPASPVPAVPVATETTSPPKVTPTDTTPPQPALAEPAEPPRAPPRATPERKQAAGRSINALTIDLQRKLARQPGNLLLSGMSVAVALSMLHAGSSGATARELAHVLHLDDAPGDTHAAFAGLAARFTHRNDNVTLDAASRLFGAEKFAFKPEYLDLTRTVFAAPLEPLDILNDPSGARDHINGWVGEQTGAASGELFPAGSIDATTRLVLADAAQFKADWLEPFDASATAPQMFYGAEHKRQVPMMRAVQRLRFALGLSGQVRVLELPYAGGEYSMVIVLPIKRGGLAEIEKQFDAARLQSWLDAAKPTSIELGLPRFSLDSSLDLAPALHKLGAARVFEPRRADLSGMASEKKLALSAVRHQARISFEERSTKATGAPAIEISVGDAPTSSVPFIVDHPFLFYIRDVRTGVLLFYGRVLDPT